MRSRPVSGNGRLGAGRNKRGTGPLLLHRNDNFIPRKNADQLIDSRIPLEQFFPLAFGKASGDDHLAQPSLLFQPQHLLDRIVRFRPGVGDESARVDDHQIGAAGIGNQPIAAALQQPGHPLAIDEVFWAAETDQGVRAGRDFLGHGECEMKEGKTLLAVPFH